MTRLAFPKTHIAFWAGIFFFVKKKTGFFSPSQRRAKSSMNMILPFFVISFFCAGPLQIWRVSRLSVFSSPFFVSNSFFPFLLLFFLFLFCLSGCHLPDSYGNCTMMERSAAKFQGINNVSLWFYLFLNILFSLVPIHTLIYIVAKLSDS